MSDEADVSRRSRPEAGWDGPWAHEDAVDDTEEADGLYGLRRDGFVAIELSRHF